MQHVTHGSLHLSIAWVYSNHLPSQSIEEAHYSSKLPTSKACGKPPKHHPHYHTLEELEKGGNIHPILWCTISQGGCSVTGEQSHSQEVMMELGHFQKPLDGKERQWRSDTSLYISIFLSLDSSRFILGLIWSITSRSGTPRTRKTVRGLEHLFLSRGWRSWACSFWRREGCGKTHCGLSVLKWSL